MDVSSQERSRRPAFSMRSYFTSKRSAKSAANRSSSSTGTSAWEWFWSVIHGDLQAPVEALHRACVEREEERCGVEVGVVRREEIEGSGSVLDGEVEGREVTHVSVEEPVRLARLGVRASVAVPVRDQKRRTLDHVDGVFGHHPSFAERSWGFLPSYQP